MPHNPRNTRANTGNKRQTVPEFKIERKAIRNRRAFEKSRGHGGRNFNLDTGFAGINASPINVKTGRPNTIGVSKPRRRTPQRPTNPHDPRSKDPFMRAGIGLGTNDTKIFTRAGMSMDLKKMRKMF